MIMINEHYQTPGTVDDCVCMIDRSLIWSHYQTKMEKGIPLRWNNLCAYERGLLSNGCGGKGGLVNPPDFKFEASCNHHDFNYWLGGSAEDRVKADDQFLDAMLFDANLLPWWRRPLHKALAYTYWSAVRMMGGKFFNSTETRSWADVRTRVLEDMEIPF